MDDKSDFMPFGPLVTISLSEHRVIITHLEVLAVMTHEFPHREYFPMFKNWIKQTFRNKIRLRFSYGV